MPKPMPVAERVSTSSRFRLKYWPSMRLEVSRTIAQPMPQKMPQLKCKEKHIPHYSSTDALRICVPTAFYGPSSLLFMQSRGGVEKLSKYIQECASLRTNYRDTQVSKIITTNMTFQGLSCCFKRLRLNTRRTYHLVNSTQLLVLKLRKPLCASHAI